MIEFKEVWTVNESRERGTNNELYFVIHSGYGKTHKDAASVRTTHSIPAACGLYYFEVKIVSKGRDGYMGIGLSAHGVNVNRLPGWDKHSYGYHGDDGNSFCSSGTGQPYGPTFTTGDVIGCGINLVDNTAFYTKNGHHLGIAFTDLPVRHFNLENFFIFRFSFWVLSRNRINNEGGSESGKSLLILREKICKNQGTSIRSSRWASTELNPEGLATPGSEKLPESFLKKIREFIGIKFSEKKN